MQLNVAVGPGEFSLFRRTAFKGLELVSLAEKGDVAK